MFKVFYRICIHVLRTLLLIVPFVSFSQHTYYVSPTGNDTWNGLYSSHQGGINGPWQTIGKANSTLLASDIVEILAGSYNGQIRPENSGIDDQNRITYRPFGDGDVIFTKCSITGEDHEQGAIALGFKNYITTTGRSHNGAEDERLFKIQAEGICTYYGNASGSEGCIIENIEMEHMGPQFAPNRGFAFADYWWEGDYETKFCVLRNCIIKGYVRNASNPLKYTEDVVTVAKNAHHLLIENNQIGTSKHVSLNFNEATTHSIVVRGNVVKNPEHTALSFYGLGENITIQHGHLIEGNTLTASGNTPIVASPGNALQYGASESIVRHNIIAEGGHETSAVDVGGLSCVMGGQILKMTDNRFYNNTIANNKRTSLGSYFYGGNSVDKGRNKWINNLVYGGSELLVRYWSAYNDGEDRYISNLFGTLNGDENDLIMNVGFGEGALSDAIATYSNPDEPDFSDWNGYSNVYHSDVNFEDYGTDYTINDDGPCYDTGAPLTIVSQADPSTGTVLHVEDARSFFKEATEFPAWMGVQPDVLAIGSTLNTAQIVQIVDVNDSLNTITIANDVQRAPLDFVWLWKNSAGEQVVKGLAPDIGASENGVEINTTTAEFKADIHIYPNPTFENIIIESELLEGGFFQYTIYDVNGKTIESSSVFGNKKAQINLFSLASGIYFINIKTEENSFFKKIMRH